MKCYEKFKFTQETTTRLAFRLSSVKLTPC